MDSFTENLLSRARERQKMLANYNFDSESKSRSQPILNSNSPAKINSESNFKGLITPVTQTLSSPALDFPSQKTLNIQNDNFNMEIKVNSTEDVHVEVKIEEEEFSSGDGKSNGLRSDARKRLNRLGQLYAGGEDANISSPIHRSEAKFLADEDESPKVLKSDAKSRKGLSKLAVLAKNFNQLEDDLKTTVSKDKHCSSPSKPKKVFIQSPIKKVDATPDKQEKTKWDKKVLDSLESQGFTRSDSTSHLVYKFEKNEKENTVKLLSKGGDTPPRMASEKNNSKDPALLSVSERKALFEKNKGTPLVPRAPFAMATPAKAGKNIVTTTPTVTPQAEITKSAGIASKVAALFENKTTISEEQIQKKVQEQRKQEMDLLLNRFQKPVERTDEITHVTEKTPMLVEDSSSIIETQSSSSKQEERRSSGNKRLSTSDSPKVAAVLSEVKRIKVSPQKAGRLYPSLTDIESATETETRSPTPTGNSSDENSFAESDDANTSFGRDVLRVVCSAQNAQKDTMAHDSSSNLSDVLDDMDDDYIDEALAYNGVHLDSHQGRKSPIETSHSFNYKNYQENEHKSPVKMITPKNSPLPTHVVDGDNVLPLQHTVSFYRKQQSQTVSTPMRQILRPPQIAEESEGTAVNERELVAEKINQLKNEIIKQELIISQTSQALNLCNSTFEFMGSTEQVEAERVLLLATHRRQAAMHERQRLEVEQTLRSHRKGIDESNIQKGTLKFSKIVLPLKQKYVTALAAAGGKGHHVVCLIKYADQVISTPLVSTIASNSKNPEMELCIPGILTLENIYNDFTITFEVYCLQAQEEVLPHEIKYHIKKSSNKLTPKKNKQDSRLIRPAKESPAGPQTVRSPTFALMGYVVFSMSTINQRQWTLINSPSMSPLEGTVEMCLSYEMELSVEHRGFLTMFEDISGFGAWHRRWCLLKGATLSYWKYPDDEKKMVPIACINLRNAITKKVGPVSRDICARLHTFLLETEREATLHDKDSLVTVCKGSKTIIRHLLSADTKEERLEWCQKFNCALAALGF